jgi:hypothetical protein
LPKTPGLLVGVHTSYINGYEGEAETRDYDEVVAELSDKDQLKTWEPSPYSPRVAAQHSQFLYSALSTEKTGTLVLPERKSVLAIAITPQLKAHSEKILSQVFDIRRLTLFPDFDGLSTSRGVNINPTEDDRW